MHRISPHEELRPCEVFDMIGGTSTGGIIAIMLGRLVRHISILDDDDDGLFQFFFLNSNRFQYRG